jgi:8-oxo-dGTP pyrophosphatase MutT (NUDIX family)
MKDTASGAHVILFAHIQMHGEKRLMVALTKRTPTAPVYEGYWSLPGGRIKE